MSSGELLLVMVDMGLFTGCVIKADSFLQQLLIFVRAHSLLSEYNHQCVMALTANSSPMLVTPDSCIGSTAALPGLLLERLTHLLQEELSTQPGVEGGVPQQQQYQQGQPQQQEQQEVALSAGLSRALCYINRHSARYGANARHKAKPRLLALMSSTDMPLQYIPTMNAIFAAQTSGVVLDALVLGSADSAFLQQATHLTGGLYMRASEPAGMLEYLLGAFSADSATREAMSIGSSSQAVDYRASCFCHKQIIDTGYICSVCLSIFCKANMKATECPTCGAPFKTKERRADGAAAGQGGTAPSAAAAAAGG